MNVDLRKYNLKDTPIRRAILKLFINCQPLTAVQILQKLIEDGLRPNKSTIYRELSTLRKAGIVQTMSLDGKTTVYELYHHHHLVCLSCQRYFPIDCNHCLKMTENEITGSDFQLIAHSLNFFGYCKKCKNLFKEENVSSSFA